MKRSRYGVVGLALICFTLAGCAGRGGAVPVRPDVLPDSTPSSAGRELQRSPATARPALPPELAHVAGLLPLRTTGVESFLARWPNFDGRGVLIAILDGGVDPGLPGLQRTSTGERKVVDLRDFSGEGRVALQPVMPGVKGEIEVEGHRVTGVGRLRRLALPPYYAGLLREGRLGSGASADLNGDGDDSDAYPVVVGKASDGWVLMTDTDGDGSLEDEDAVRDYSVAGEIFGYGSRPMTLAVNLGEDRGTPILDLVFDNSSHGTHVAGIAAGYNLFGVAGFNGVAPGAQLLALKIANNSRGKISVSGSMWRALSYAAAYAASRDMPLIINLSYGVGNEVEGSAVIDSLMTQFALEHPEVLIVVSAGNDGPGLSTLLFPSSSDLVLSVCALFPGAFIRPPRPDLPPALDVLGWWSARGGEVSKPDLCAPGVAFSNVPPWKVGQEISAGTSMAAPYVSGAAALLQSALLQTGRRARAAELQRALLATARPVPSTSVLDAGAGVLKVEDAFRWLRAGHQAGRYLVRALPDGANSSRSSAAFRRSGLASEADTVQRFEIVPVEGNPSARLVTFSDAPWLRGAKVIELSGTPTVVTLTYHAASLRDPGLYVGSLWARPASDTLAGWTLRLTNTIIVPHSLDRPLEAGGGLEPGAVARYFVLVPAGSGGLEVSAELTGGSRAAVSLFEPTGRPARGGERMELRASDSTAHRLEVNAEDLIPGVYEITIASPPGESIRYRLRAALPPVSVAAITGGPAALLVNRSSDSLKVRLRGEIVGAAREFSVRGSRNKGEEIQVALPRWASYLTLEVDVPLEVWRQVTDFGITFFDRSGRKIADAPLNYAFGRYRMPVDSSQAGSEISVELLPAFALPDPADLGWHAKVRAIIEPAEYWPLGNLSAVAQADSLLLPPGAILGLSFGAPALEAIDGLPGFEPVVRVVATPFSGSEPSSVRQSVLSRSGLAEGSTER